MADVRTPAEWNASLYDAKFSCIPSYGQDLLPLLDARRGERILDLGCGTGQLTAKIAESGAEVVGVDRSPSMIAEARSHHPDLRFEVTDARELYFDVPFDGVFSNAVLHWIQEPEKVIAGVARCLKPGGRFVLEMGGQGNIAAVRAALHAAFDHLGRSDLSARNPWYFPGIGQYSALLDALGFRTIFAALFDRPTPLQPGDDAFRSWLDVFGKDFLDGMEANTRESIVREVEDRARGNLYRDDRWVIDYVRLRVVAIRTEPSEGGATEQTALEEPDSW